MVVTGSLASWKPAVCIYFKKASDVLFKDTHCNHMPDFQVIINNVMFELLDIF